MVDDSDIPSHDKEGGSEETKFGRKRCMKSSLDVKPIARRRRKQESYGNPLQVTIKIISASYGPCEFNALDDSDASSLPYTRDCTPFLLDLLEAARRRERKTGLAEEVSSHQDRDRCNAAVRLSPTVNGKIENFVYLLQGVESDEREHVSMNAVFGDPCPGKTKRLQVKYTVTENCIRKEASPLSALPHTLTEIHRVTFAEHETVKLRRRLTHAMKVMGENDGYEENELTQVDHGDESLGNGLFWKLQLGTSEITLPIILPFLSLWERMQCRLICRCWKKVVQECGVSRSIDVNSADIESSRAITTGRPYANRCTLTRSMLRGLLANSYSSLQSLFLNGFQQLCKEDLHPALPSLRNLNILDISHCTRLDNTTLQLLADPSLPSSTTLRVLYLKGLDGITDEGLIALCNSCSRLEVLDLSHLNSITDQGAQCIKQLIFLRALFLRDNWQLTNESIDAITKSCSKLEQLTLWGCHRLKNLEFENCSNIPNANTSKRLVILNLWGCHGLEDNVAHTLSNIPNVSCLMVSECHRLSDRFVQILVEGVAQRKRGKGGLRHLHLRYLKRITDNAVIAIALNLHSLLSLDLSFCSKITYTGIYRLLDELRSSLVELRLNHCLSITPQIRHTDRRRRNHGLHNNNRNSDHAGHWILNALRRRPHSSIDHSLCLLDVRGCGGQPERNKPYPNGDPFVKGMSALQFEQSVPGFFSRTARSR